MDNKDMNNCLTPEQIDDRLSLDFNSCAKFFKIDMKIFESVDLMSALPFIENVPELELDRWNSFIHKSDNNCTNFAFDRCSIDKHSDYLQPGKIGNNEREHPNYKKETLFSVSSDPLRPIDSFLDCNDREFPVALFHEKGKGDYHWLALRKNNEFGLLSYLWAHKMGWGDADTVPENDIFKEAKSCNYSVFLGYFAVPHSLHQ